MTAEAVAVNLRPHVRSVFFAPESIEAGGSFVQQLNDALAACSAAVVVWSSAAARSAWVTSELNALLVLMNQRPVRVYLLAVDGTRPPPLLAHLQIVQVQNGIVDPSAWSKLLAAPADALRQPSPVDVQTLDPADWEILGAAIERVASDVLSGSRRPTLTVTLSGATRVYLAINLDALRPMLVGLEGVLRVIDAIKRRRHFLKRQMQGPATVFIDFADELRSKDKDLAAEHAALRDHLRALVEHCVLVEPPALSAMS